MTKSSLALKLLLGAVFSVAGVANAADSHCSPSYLTKKIGTESFSFVSCVNIDAAQKQFKDDFLAVKIESSLLNEKYQKQSSMAGITGDATAPLVINAINNQLGAMYEMASKKDDFSKYMTKLQNYYGAAHCTAKLENKSEIVVSCPELGKFPSFKDVYHISKAGKFQFDSVGFGQISALKNALGGFQAKLEKLYSHTGDKH